MERVRTKVSVPALQQQLEATTRALQTARTKLAEAEARVARATRSAEDAWRFARTVLHRPERRE
jgi:hypothetical protein